MSDYARIFQSGGSQAIRLPDEYRFEGQERVRALSLNRLLSTVKA